MSGWRVDPLDRRILALAVPALGALVIEPLYNLVDSAIVGHLGARPLAGLAIATAALNLVGWTAAFIEMATVSAVSFRRGAGDDAGAARLVGAAYLLSGVLGVLVGGLLELVATPLAVLLGGHGGPVAGDAVRYLRIAAIGMPALLVSLAGNGHLTGLADTRRPLAIALASNLVNLGLEIAFVYGLHLGIAGSACGTVAAQTFAAACFAATSRVAPLRPRRPGREELARLLADGAPLTVRTVALGVALLATTAIAGRLGTAPLGGHQVAMQVWNLLSLALDALAVPAQVFVSEALGAGEALAARRIGQRVLRLGLLTGGAVGIATMLLAPVLPALFSPDRSVQHQATVALLVCGAQQPLAAAAFVLDGLLLGAGDYAAMRRTMLLALLAFAPLAALTLAVPGVGILGVWLAMCCWLAARSLLLGRRWRAITAGAGT